MAQHKWVRDPDDPNGGADATKCSRCGMRRNTALAPNGNTERIVAVGLFTGQVRRGTTNESGQYQGDIDERDFGDLTRCIVEG